VGDDVAFAEINHTEIEYVVNYEEIDSQNIFLQLPRFYMRGLLSEETAP
jgi:hypothetical protein